VNGSLTKLSPHHGFRKFVQAKAKEMGITGSIQRYHYSDVQIQFEGTIPQMKLFTSFLCLCREQGMIGMFDDYKQNSYAIRLFDDFHIDNEDFCRNAANGGKVIKGPNSDGDEYGNMSEYSANSPMLLGTTL
jgi:acylphosphatase